MAKLFAEEFERPFLGKETGRTQAGIPFSNPAPAKDLDEAATFSKKELGQFAKNFGTALRVQSIFAQAQENKHNLDAQASALQTQLTENRFRHDVHVRQLRKQAQKAVGARREAFQKAGVKLEGTAIDVVADTMNDLLEAELLKEREFAYMEEQNRVAQAGLRSRRDAENTKALLSAGATLLGGINFGE